jgi:hypothetical protein
VTDATDLHYGHRVIEDDDGDTYYVAGHVPDRRALAAANRYARTVAGFANLYDCPGTTIDGFLRVERTWWRPDSAYPSGEEWQECGPDDPDAQPFTEVRL